MIAAIQGAKSTKTTIWRAKRGLYIAHEGKASLKYQRNWNWNADIKKYETGEYSKVDFDVHIDTTIINSWVMGFTPKIPKGSVSWISKSWHQFNNVFSFVTLCALHVDVYTQMLNKLMFYLFILLGQVVILRSSRLYAKSGTYTTLVVY